MANANLQAAKAAKNDEFYTRLEDIEAEIFQHQDYVRQFYGKTVYCNCDDPNWSNFYVFFRLHFKQLKLRKLITTHFNPDGSPSFKIEWEGETLNGDTLNLIKTPLKGDGDFASEECVEILKTADIIVTNPPFSVAREKYIPLLFKYGKKFIIIGDMNWVAYKDVFPLFKENKMIFGYNNVKQFRSPDGTIKKFGNKVWFTNLDLDKAHEPLILTKNYYGNEEKYPRYDNYAAVECGKVKDIPKDYFPCWYDCPHVSECKYAQTEGKADEALCEQSCNGEIVVPITYAGSHCPEQMEIVGSDTELAEPEIIENGQIGRGRFYLAPARPSVDAPPPPVQKTLVQQVRHSQVAENVMDSSEYRLHSSQACVQNSSELSDSTGMSMTIQTRDIGLQSTKEKRMQGFLYEKCNGLIGVPITYFSTYCAQQFDIVGLLQSSSDEQAGTSNLRRYDEFKEMRQDMTFTGASGKKANGNPVLSGKSEKGNFLFNEATGEYVHSVFARVLVRRKPISGRTRKGRE